MDLAEIYPGEDDGACQPGASCQGGGQLFGRAFEELVGLDLEGQLILIGFGKGGLGRRPDLAEGSGRLFGGQV